MPVGTERHLRGLASTWLALWLGSVPLVAAGAQGTSEATAVVPEAAPVSWTIPYAPLEGGRLEARVGLALQGTTPPEGGLLLNGAPLVTARLGISRRLQVALPLMLSVSLNEGGGGVPRLVLSGGAAGLGWSSLEGPIVIPALAASLHWSGEEWAAVAALGTKSGALTRYVTDVELELAATALVARRLSERVSLSLAVGVGWRANPAEGGLSPSWALGGSGNVPVSVLAPTLRVRVLPTLSTEAWLQVGGTFQEGPTSGAAGLSVSWTPELWGEDGS
jgi:hypothetical protein